jgi:CRP-like cAMP-binding protein
MEQVEARVVNIKNGEPIIEEDTWAYYAYILKEGKARVYKEINGKQTQVGTINKGDVFGIMSFFFPEQAKRTATIIADGDVTVGMVLKDTFLNMLDKLPLNTRVNLNSIVASLKSMNEIDSRLFMLLKDLQYKGKVDSVNVDSEDKYFPEFIFGAADTMAESLVRAVERVNRQTMLVTEKIKFVKPNRAVLCGK